MRIEYFRHLAASGHSTHTLALRRAHLRRIESVIRGGLDSATLAELETYLARPGLSNEYRRSIRATMRSYYGWLHTTGVRADNPAIQLPRVKPTQPNPRPTPDVPYRAALRDANPDERLMLQLAADGGLRRGEVCQVHERDLVPDLDGLSLVVRGKGGKVRIVPLKTSLEIALTEHFRRIGGGYAFPGRIDGHLSAAYVGKRISKLLPEGITMHSLRHRFATKVHQASGDLLTTQKLLGHASPATTQIYVEIGRDRLRAAVNAA